MREFVKAVGSDAPDFHHSSLGSTSSFPAEAGLPGEAGGPRVSPGASPGDSADDSQVGKEEHPPRRGHNPSGEARPEPYGITPHGVVHLRYSGTPSDYHLTLADWTVTGRLAFASQRVSQMAPLGPFVGAPSGRAGWGGCLSSCC